ncbi:transcriptional regulator [Methylobacterium sp. W2]|nr:transcriptional regulator [Methylobacterium sp. W2]
METVSLSRADVDTIAGHFRAISDHVPLRVIRTDAEYETAVDVMNGLLDAGAGEDHHPLAGVLGLLGGFIADYDSAHHGLPDVPPAEILRLLMEQNGVKQSDLPEIGSQGVVSEILSGKRDLNLGQIKRLATRFGIEPATFL